MSARVREGSPLPLGARWIAEEDAYNFAIYSKHAESLTLLLYRRDELEQSAHELALDYLRHKSGQVWHCRVDRGELPGVAYYAYRADGPRLADCIAGGGRGGAWHNFDPSKILFDPYARDLVLPTGFDARAACQPGMSNAGRAPLGVLPEPRADAETSDAVPLPIPDPARRIIYELHVRGFTRSETSGVTAELRGTYAGLVEKIPYLRELGVTAVELMPVFQFDEIEPNYWGYMPLGFFAPHRGYASDKAPFAPRREFRHMVERLHEAGIEVLLDVVYNHTGEGNHEGPTFSFKGIDNTTYYLMSGDPSTPYQNFSGAGNTFHCANRAVRQLIGDSLRHWASEMGVDGFRFDEASIFSRDSRGAIAVEDPAIFGQLAGDPLLARLCLIAEPWDVGKPGDAHAGDRYQLGRNFPGITWLQWNDRFRDDVRHFVKGDGGLVGALMHRLYGSDDLFPDDRAHAYRPFQSVNYVSCHDGLTLYDLVSYTDPTEGSWDCGHAGAEGAPVEIEALRRRQAKNFACLLLLASGTPMIRAGDEFLSTQHGAGNPYDDDSPRTWLDWSRLDEHRDVFRFFARMIAFRKAHPVLSPSRFWRESVRWYGCSGSFDPGGHELAFALEPADGGEAIYAMINAHWEEHEFTILSPGTWRRAIDTSLPAPDDIVEAGERPLLAAPCYRVPGRSIAVLTRDASPEP